MTFQQLQFVVEISRCASINKAAQNLFVSQSGISTAIKELEKELGVILFERTNRGVVLASAGEPFLSFAQSILEQKNQFESTYKDKGQSHVGLLSISSQRYPFAEDAFINFIQKSDTEHYRFHIEETSMYKVIENVYDNHSDIGIIFMSDLTEKLIKHILQSRQLEFFPIQKIQPSVFIRKGHPLSAKTLLSTEDLIDYPYLAFKNDQVSTFELSEEIHLISMKMPERIIYVNDRAMAMNIIYNTNAVTTGSGLLIEGLTDPELISIPIGTEDKMQLGWIKQINKPLSKYAMDYVEELIASVKRSIIYTSRIRKKLDKV